MDIAQLLTTSSTSAGTSAAKSVGFSAKPSMAFNDYMNSFLEAANEVKSIRSGQVREDFSFERKLNNSNRDEDQIFESLGELPMTPMSLEEKEAFERIAILVADGSLDSEALAKISEEELTEVVQWVLAGADGLFEPYQEVELDGTEEITSEVMSFGLEGGLEALGQLEEVYSKLGDKSLDDSETAAIAKLINIDELDVVEIDKLSQAILKLAEKYAGAEQGEAGLDTDKVAGAEINLREMLESIPVDEIVSEINAILEESDVEVELPELPETVLKSLCIEVVNINNRMLDAADTKSKLLDGLNNNEELREQILSNMVQPEEAAGLVDAVNTENLGGSEVVAGELAEAVLEDSTPEELAELESEMLAAQGEEQVEPVGEKADLTPVDNAENTEVLEEVAVAGEAELQVEQDGLTKDSNEQENVVKSDSAQKNIAELEDGERVKITVNTEEEVAEQDVAKNAPKDTGKDSLTGRAFSGDNAEQSEDELDDYSEDGTDAKQKKDGDFKESFNTREDSLNGTKSNFNESFAEAESKVDFKAFSSEVTQTSYSSDNPYVKYADMVENIDRLTRLMISNSEKVMKSVTMELSPPELGKLTIEVSVKDGQASAAIKVETDGAKQMLLNNVEQLKRNLESHGLKLENFEVELNKQEQDDRDNQNAFAQAQQDQNNKSKRRQNGNIVNEGQNQDAEDGVDVEIDTGSGVSEDGSVDIVA